MIITDQAPSTKVAMAKIIKVFKLKPNCHCTSKYLNNFIEQDHRHIKKDKISKCQYGKNTLKGIECIYGLYKTVGLFRSMDFHHATKLVIC